MMTERIYRLIFIPAVLCTFSVNVFASQAIPAEEYGIANRLQNTTQGHALDVQGDNLASEDNHSATFFVSKVSVDAEKILSNNDKIRFNNILSQYENKKISLSDLNKAVSEINSFFRSKGYPAATAYIPEQESSNGIILINVELGRVGNVHIENNSKLSKKMLVSMLSGMKDGDTIKSRKLETALYNINDLGGVKASGHFKAGENIGESDIVIKVDDTKRESYAISVDNNGSKNSGRYRYIVSGEWDNFVGNGERILANVSVSNKNQHNYGVQFERLIAKNGTKMSIVASKSDYELGSHYSSI